MSNSDEWETPLVFFDKLNDEFNFGLDPCATTATAQCKNFYTIEDNGLEKNWNKGVVFCNPPYSQSAKWIEKCYMESKKGAICVLLIPARTDTIAFHKYIYNKAEIRFIKGRLKFSNSKNSAPFPSMIVIFKNI